MGITKKALQAQMKELTESWDECIAQRNQFEEERNELANELDVLMVQQDIFQADNDCMVKIIGELTVKLAKAKGE